MKYMLLAAAMLLAACDDEARHRINFNNCVDGARQSPGYAEVVKACADTAIRIREQQQQRERP